MRYKATLLIAAALLLGTASCKIDDPSPAEPVTPPADTTPAVDDFTPYVGTYDVEFVYDSVYTSGQWFPNKPPYPNYDPDSGYMRLSRTTTDSTLDMHCCVVFTGSGTPDTMPKYVTTAIMRNGVLQPQQHTFTLESGTTYDIKYTPLRLTPEGLVFTIEQYFEYIGYPFGYKMTATCTRRRIKS